MLSRNKNGQTIIISNMNETQKHNVESKMTETKEYILRFHYLENSKRRIKYCAKSWNSGSLWEDCDVRRLSAVTVMLCLWTWARVLEEKEKEKSR